ncbi:MAG: SEC-C metal-binding domain-containing protein [Chthoniobacteraceae bacterium]|jgi:preprotein translocase subunit SecA
MNTATGDIAYLEHFQRTLSPEMLKGVVVIDRLNLSPFHQRQLEQTGQTKVARNSPCPCGSGRKFKLCCFRP